ncbi:MAG TPA: HipA N-terminal domain-containing protein, partial [Actinoplanes sp.]|nr:HipA N-terminal domain-containing protein [Actinoplanes sp.]
MTAPGGIDAPFPIRDVTTWPKTREEQMGSTPSTRRLFLIWQNPSTRKFAQVGALVQMDDGTYTFRYLRRAIDLPEFHPLASFPDLHRIYRSTELPPFFGNRVMSARRPDFAEHVRAMSLDIADATPFEVLARTGGGRATDTF